MKETTKESLSKWKNRISWAERTLEPRIEEWKENQRIFETRQKDGEEFITSIPFSSIFTLISLLFTALPKIVVIPKKPENKQVMDAEFLERVIEDTWNKSDMFNVVFQAIYAAAIYSIGFIKVGYYEKAKERKLEEDEIFDNFIEEYPEGNEEDLEEYSSIKTNISEDIVDESGIAHDYVHPKDILIDPEATSIEAAKWIIHRIPMTRTEFEGEFSSKIKFDDLGAESKKEAYTEDDNSLQDFLNSEDSDRVIIYEVWSKEDNKRYIVSEGYDKFIYSGDWPYDMDSYPFEEISIIPKHNKVGGLSLIQMGKNSIDIINAINSKQRDDVMRAKSLITYEKGAIDEDQLDKANSPENKTWVEVNDATRINQFVTTPFPPDHYKLRDDAERSFNDITRISATQRQAETGRKETATFHSLQSGAANTLMSFYQRRIERTIEKLCQKQVALIKQFYNEDNFVYITNYEDRKPFFLQWSAEDIGEYTFSVKAGSAAFQDNGLKLQQGMQAFKLTMDAAKGGFIPNPKPIIQDSLYSIYEALGRDIEVIKKAFEEQPQPKGIVMPQQQMPGNPAAKPAQQQMPEKANAGVTNPNVPTINQTQPQQPQPFKQKITRG